MRRFSKAEMKELFDEASAGIANSKDNTMVLEKIAMFGYTRDSLVAAEADYTAAESLYLQKAPRVGLKISVSIQVRKKIDDIYECSPFPLAPLGFRLIVQSNIYGCFGTGDIFKRVSSVPQQLYFFLEVAMIKKLRLSLDIEVTVTEIITPDLIQKAIAVTNDGKHVHIDQKMLDMLQEIIHFSNSFLTAIQETIALEEAALTTKIISEIEGYKTFLEQKGARKNPGVIIQLFQQSGIHVRRIFLFNKDPNLGKRWYHAVINASGATEVNEMGTISEI